MSRHEWEHGTIKIPEKEWLPFRKGLNVEANRARGLDHETRLRVWESLSDPSLIKRARDAVEAWNGKQEDPERLVDSAQVTAKEIYNAVNECSSVEIEEALVGFPVRQVPIWLRCVEIESDELAVATGATMFKDGKVVRPKSPKRIPLTVTSYSVGYEGQVTLDSRDRTVTWEVSENNRACESAREHPLGVAFFGLLGRIVWSDGSGGQIRGNDDCNQEEGVGDYVTGTYGPLAKERTRS